MTIIDYFLILPFIFLFIAGVLALVGYGSNIYFDIKTRQKQLETIKQQEEGI
jgi:hypothetical protein